MPTTTTCLARHWQTETCMAASPWSMVCALPGWAACSGGQVWTPPVDWLYESPEEFTARCGRGKLWRDGLPRKHHSSIFPEDYFCLVSQRADILVTHEAPSAHPHGFEAIDELARSLRVAKAFHGRHHDSLDYSRDRARLGFAAFGVGFCGVTDMNGSCVQPGKFDQVRAARLRQGSV